MDVSTPVLFAVLVEGNLIFQDKDLTFDAYYVIARGGTIRIGTYKQPFQSKLVITMHGTIKTKFLPEFGNKCFGTHEGIIDMHGVPRVPTFTLLSKTVNAGEKQVINYMIIFWLENRKFVSYMVDLN